MTEAETRAVVRAFYDRWTAGDPGDTRVLLADDFVYRSPNVDFDNPDDTVASLAGFRRLCSRIDLVSELYGDGEATLIYDVHTTTPAGTMRSVDHFRVAGGRISSLQLIFDATGWRVYVESLGRT